MTIDLINNGSELSGVEFAVVHGLAARDKIITYITRDIKDAVNPLGFASSINCIIKLARGVIPIYATCTCLSLGN